MLEFKKRVLLKVSFDLFLFEKELRKAYEWLTDVELKKLKSWCYKNFGEVYKPILDKVFLAEDIQIA